MRPSKFIRDQGTVLNIDAFDRRRFQEIFKLSAGLQGVREQSSLPTIEALLRDIWASFYKMKPSLLKESCSPTLAFNQRFMTRWLQSKEFKEIHLHTKLDDFSSAICTVKVCEQLNEWARKMNVEDLFSGIPAQNLQESPKELEQTMTREESVVESEQADEPFDHELKDLFDFLLSEDDLSMSKFAKDVLAENIYLKNELGILIGGKKAGTSNASLMSLPLREKFLLAEELIHNDQLRKIVEWAGRIKEMNQAKKSMEKTLTVNRSGISFGNELEKILPAELALYQHAMARTDFLHRFSKSEVMQFDIRKRSTLGKGPIIICLDQSDSMSSFDVQSKGLILAILSIAKKQQRNLSVILFSKETLVFEYKKGLIKRSELMHLARTYLRGGTDFAVALTAALKILDSHSFRKADLLFVSDSEGDLCDDFLERFHVKRQKKNFQVHSIVIGREASTLGKFSDKISFVDNLNDPALTSFLEI